jgi:hypothetical protein
MAGLATADSAVAQTFGRQEGAMQTAPRPHGIKTPRTFIPLPGSNAWFRLNRLKIIQGFWPYSGDSVSGSGSYSGQSWQAVAFTATENVQVQTVEIGANYISGTNGINIGIWSDAGGLPGEPLASGDVTGLQGQNACCVPAVMTIKKGVALTSGTQYWIVLSTDDSNADAVVQWGYNVTDVSDQALQASNNGSGWVPYLSPVAVNFAIGK